MNRFRIILSLVVVAAALVFAWRHHSLRQLQRERDNLRNEEASNLQASVAEANVSTTNSPSPGLSAAERSELLRLRGQIGGLRQELAQETNQLAKISRSPRVVSAPAEVSVSREEAVMKLSLARQWMVALLIYAQDHENRFPESLSDAASLAGNATSSVDEIELVQGGVPLSGIQSPSTTIVVREKRPWKGPAGRWSRSYGFADGHAEIARSDTEDFADWEKSKAQKNP